LFKLLWGGHSKYNRYIQRFFESCGGIGDISIKKRKWSPKENIFLSAGRGPPFLLLYTVEVG
jgi:hypothetical protein